MKKIIYLSLLLSITVFFSACVSSGSKETRQYMVYVAQNGIITFNGETLKSAELPNTLLDKGVTPKDRILLISQGDVPGMHIQYLATACAKVGLANCTIVTSKPMFKVSTGPASDQIGK